ncbi:MAG: hypothetical protein LBP50_05720, partial [Tannerella sp.]|nr:hypothetical protein [Tannerella sp.]
KQLCIAALATVLFLSCGREKETLTLSGLKQSDFAAEVGGNILTVYDTSRGTVLCMAQFDKSSRGETGFTFLSSGRNPERIPTFRLPASRNPDGF